jgi:hypothetical protein
MANLLTKEKFENQPQQKEAISQKGKESVKDQEKLAQTARELVSGVDELVENADIMTSGEVSEDKEGGKNIFAGGGGQATTQTSQARAKRLTLPSLEIMRKEVAVEIKKEIRTLEREAKRIMSNPKGFSPFTLNSVVSKIRELKDILNQLAYATVETLKGWWMKFVKHVST